ncbi:MAG: winged helix-turn-helix domain-containing protein [Ferrovibrio sp.]
MCRELEDCRWYRNLSPYGEPQLGRRGLYHSLGRTSEPPETLQALMWVLNQSDGHHDLQAIAAKAGLPFELISRAADAAEKAGILQPV